ncbi:MAG: HAD-IA family hydrolase [Pseudomonadota bacterium]
MNSSSRPQVPTIADGAFDAVLFDLDGTLIDTAPDMVRALKSMQSRHGVQPVEYHAGRAQVSNGAIGLLRVGFPESDVTFGDAMHHEFLDIYAEDLARDSALFPGLAPLLERLEAADVPWGIVTNKPGFLTERLLEALCLHTRCAVTVCGDTLPVRKPDPAPVLHAATLAGLNPASTLFVGDARRDIDAGRGAGMTTIAAAYGYITDDDDAARWDADTIAADTGELTQIILKAVNLAA